MDFRCKQAGDTMREEGIIRKVQIKICLAAFINSPYFTYLAQKANFPEDCKILEIGR